MEILKNAKRIIATVLSVTTSFTPGLVVSANGENNKIITVQCGESALKKLPLVYNDDYFNNSSFEYNESLATASLALELSGFANRSDYTNQAKNAKQALKELDFGDIEENDDYKHKTEADTIGVVAANKKIKSNNEEYTLIPVVIRGGGYEQEWIGNAKVGKSGDHEGFNTAATKAKNFVDNYIQNKNIQGKVKLWIVGYSRGGATAGLLGVKFNNDFKSTLNELPAESKSCSNEDYYNSYVNKEKERTYKKYGKEIEMNPNDLYVYTFEAPMGMNIVSGSGLEEYEGDIPYSKSEKNNRASYDNIHNTVNDDDFVTKVAPKDWGFVRPGVDHKLLEGRKDNDIKDMESILYEFLVNKVSKAIWDKKDEKGKKEISEFAAKYVGNKLAKNKWTQGIYNYSEFSDRIIDTVNKSIDRVRRGKYATDMTNREFYANTYQQVISKLAGSIMADRFAFNQAFQEIKGDWLDIARLGFGGIFNTNYLDAPFNNAVDKISKNVNTSFSKEERKKLLDLLKGVDQNSNFLFLVYAGMNGLSIFEMHKPEVHLATLISKDKNREIYVNQIKKINDDYSKEQEKMKEEQKKFEQELAEGKFDLDNFNLKDDVNVEKEDKKEEEKSVFMDDVVNVEKEDKKEEEKSAFMDGVVNVEKEDKKEEKSDFEDENGFMDIGKKYTKRGYIRALKFKQQQQEKEKANAKGLYQKTMGVIGKGLKTGVKLVFSPMDETLNVCASTKEMASHTYSGLKKRGSKAVKKITNWWYGK